MRLEEAFDYIVSGEVAWKTIWQEICSPDISFPQELQYDYLHVRWFVCPVCLCTTPFGVNLISTGATRQCWHCGILWSLNMRFYLAADEFLGISREMSPAGVRNMYHPTPLYACPKLPDEWAPPPLPEDEIKTTMRVSPLGDVFSLRPANAVKLEPLDEIMAKGDDMWNHLTNFIQVPILQKACRKFFFNQASMAKETGSLERVVAVRCPTCASISILTNKPRSSICPYCGNGFAVDIPSALSYYQYVKRNRQQLRAMEYLKFMRNHWQYWRHIPTSKGLEDKDWGWITSADLSQYLFPLPVDEPPRFTAKSVTPSMYSLARGELNEVRDPESADTPVFHV
jgi:hypothetical protein